MSSDIIKLEESKYDKLFGELEDLIVDLEELADKLSFEESHFFRLADIEETEDTIFMIKKEDIQTYMDEIQFELEEKKNVLSDIQAEIDKIKKTYNLE